MSEKAKELKTLVRTLKIYADTDEPVSQQFFQGLCLKASETIVELEAQPDLQGEIEWLNGELRLWKNRTMEAANAVAEFENIQAENKWLKDGHTTIIKIIDGHPALWNDSTTIRRLCVISEQALNPK